MSEALTRKYVKSGSVDNYIKDLVSKDIEQITIDGEKNKIINGITDWVYEEEFGFVRAFEWNISSDKIAFIIAAIIIVI